MKIDYTLQINYKVQATNIEHWANNLRLFMNTNKGHHHQNAEEKNLPTLEYNYIHQQCLAVKLQEYSRIP